MTVHLRQGWARRIAGWQPPTPPAGVEVSTGGDSPGRNMYNGWIAFFDKATGEKIGYLDYNSEDIDKTLVVAMIEVEPQYRRQGWATRLLEYLKAEMPGYEIESGYRTSEGDAWWRSVTSKVLVPLVVAPGTFYRVHPKGRPFSKADAQSTVFNHDQYPKEIRRIMAPVAGYSSFANPHHLYQYAEDMGWPEGEDEYGLAFVADPVVRFTGTVVGEGADGEPVVMPTSGILERIKWRDFRDRLEVTPGYWPRWDQT